MKIRRDKERVKCHKKHLKWKRTTSGIFHGLVHFFSPCKYDTIKTKKKKRGCNSMTLFKRSVKGKKEGN